MIMKPYFAKYLPVEGEIKEEDCFFLPEVYMTDPDLYFNNIVKCTSISEEVYHYEAPCTVLGTVHSGVFKKDNPKKVKLFLCSRDIKVGDNVFWDTNDQFRGYWIAEDFCLERNNRIVTQDNTSTRADEAELIKVIGEISPNATWVKEGDEFNEDEIRYKTLHKGEYILISLSSEGWTWEDWSPKGEIFAIKGPCGHYH